MLILLVPKILILYRDNRSTQTELSDAIKNTAVPFAVTELCVLGIKNASGLTLFFFFSYALEGIYLNEEYSDVFIPVKK